MKLINILGIKLNVFTKKEALTEIEKLLVDKEQHFLVTPNPEMILQAIGHDEEFFYILNKADLSFPDGFGLKIAAWFMGKNLSRITGADIVKDILKLAEKQDKKVAIFNWKGGLSSAQDITVALAKQYPKLKLIIQDIDKFKYNPAAPLVRGETQNSPNPFYQGEITQFQSEIIFCTLGSPYQEKFIFHNLKNLPSVKIGIGVGGAFDFLTGKIKRAPKLFRVIGLEWLWRLLALLLKYIFQANKAEYFIRRRIKRIYNAVVIFPIKFFLWRFILPFFYRSNVVCLLFKKELVNDAEKIKYKILIIERADEKNHWQLPQGGTDGENLLVAGRRELNEEINNNKFQSIAIFSKLYIYKFNKEIFKFGALAKDVWGYQGQKQGLFIAEFLGQDKDIKINFWEHSAWRWVDSTELVDQVYQKRKQATKIFLDKFNSLPQIYKIHPVK
ncbi:MAG: WecB/TagA/CpsF family glycosyltransferase [Patescibacteria group bacterium]